MKDIEHWDLACEPVDQTGIKERIQSLKTRSLKKEAKMHALKMALSMIDLTTLEGKDTAAKVSQMCRKAITPHLGIALPSMAAVCVYPNWVATAKKAVGGTGVKVASVATAFPSGNLPIKLRLREVKMAIDEGADEIDMVINRGAMLSGLYTEVYQEIKAVKDVCGKSARLKVILETGELENLDQVRKASFIAMQAGADFIKTSTGKIKPAATPEVSLTMLLAIQDFYNETGIQVGMKPAGGIADAKAALFYLTMVYETLGEQWLNNYWFRFGASRLANDILLQIEKQTTGRYQSPDYFSKD